MRLFRIAMLAAAGLVTAQASDFIGIYGVITKVVFEPNADHPQRVQVFGTFAVAGAASGMVYLPAERGYLYFTLDGLPADRQQGARDEWNDLKMVAGTGKAIGFSGRLMGQSPVRVRKANEPASAPEQYRLGFGAASIRSDTNYAPVRDVTEASRKPQS